MRVLPALGILAAAAAMFVAGCGRSGSAWMGIEEPTPPARPNFRADRLGSANKRFAEPNVRMKARGRHVAADAGDTFTVSEKIAGRIADNRKDWEEYRTGLSTQPRIRESGKESAGTLKVTTPETRPQDTTPLISPAVKRKYSAEYVNAQMRISLLEKHIKSADDAERKILETKLEQAKSELQAIDKVSREESQPPDTEFSSGRVEIQPAVRR